MAKKLRILCLHGFNTTKAIMKFQMANFTQAFDSICEFEFIEAPSDCKEDPLAFFVKMGINPPYKQWALIPKNAPQCRAESNYVGVYFSIKFIVNHLNQ